MSPRVVYTLHSFLDHNTAVQYFKALERELVYEKDSYVTVFGKRYKIKRDHVGYGDPGLNYKFSGTTLAAKDWTPTLLDLKSKIEAYTGLSFNFVLVNRYKDGSCYISPHSDNEACLDQSLGVVALSLGAKRKFQFSQNGRIVESIYLPNGSLLTFPARTNVIYKHGIPKEHRVTSCRISLTFRRILY